MTPAELAELKKDGAVQQRQKEFFVLRLRLVAGDARADILETAARVAQRFGRGEVHFTTRQSLEIPWIPADQVPKAKKALTDGGALLSVSGPRVRAVVGCPGSQVCRFGQADTKALARTLDSLYFGADVPHKFKLAVTGCAHNCAKATENDVGLMGVVEPVWDPKACIDCGLCVGFCPTQAIARDADGTYTKDSNRCLGCPQCLTSCPKKAWSAGRRGLAVFVGGTMGKLPQLAHRLPGLHTEAGALELVDRTLAFYRAHGQKRERLARTLERVGWEPFLQAVCPTS